MDGTQKLQKEIKDFSTAFSSLASCYANGIGTEKDLEKALFWYRKAANYGDPFAAVEIAKIDPNQQPSLQEMARHDAINKVLSQTLLSQDLLK